MFVLLYLLVEKVSLEKSYLNTLWSPNHQGPIVQSVVSLTSLLVVKRLTGLVSTISYLQLFLLKKVNAKATHIFFRQNISVYAIFDDQRFNDTLTNNIISFEKLGLGN